MKNIMILILLLPLTLQQNFNRYPMNKLWIFSALFIAFTVYSSWIYTDATDYGTPMTERQQLGKKIYQEYNCQSCHQIFGLGGYLGPELTTIISDKTRGEAFARAFIENGGGTRMPKFNFTKEETEALVDYLKHVDANAFSYKNTSENKQKYLNR
jgi:nitric oxide reductase subunit C